MHKKEIKRNIKEFHKAVEENQNELRTLSVLQPSLPEQEVFTQDQEYIKRNVNLYTREKAFSVPLEKGPYRCSYTANGSHMLVTSRSGHAAAFDAQNLNLCFETMLDEIYDAKWLHNEQYFAAAQEDCVFVYDKTGSELHAVRDMCGTRLLEFLPYHFLLAGATENGFVHYLDTSTGEMKASLFVGEKNPLALRANPATGVIHLGTRTGQVSLWAPCQKEFLMKVKCHKAAITGIEMDRTGNFMFTTGQDNKMCVFDIRNTYKPIKTTQMKTPVHFTALSQRNLLALGHGNKVSILKDVPGKTTCVMRHTAPGTVSSLSFCNHEDILTIGHSNGFSSIVVPGSGDPVYDTSETSPFMSVRERQRQEVRRLLEKIPADMIGLNSVLCTGAKPTEKLPDEGTVRYFEAGASSEKRGALARFTK